MKEWDDILRDLADDPSDYEREAGLAILFRQGIEHSLDLKDMPGIGLAVVVKSPKAGETPSFVPSSTYIQRDLLGLPRLARQITRTLEKSWAKRPVRFVEGPAERTTGAASQRFEAASQDLRSFLKQTDPDTTRVMQLMAAAGQGKTVLLEQLSIEFAREYQPDPHPSPILLTVDLLGRYVGTVDDAIAGSLNNTYVFPGLSQRDVALCVRQRWLLLALDGFDELVARVGVRDAFLRIAELLDQLRGSGTIIVSARESFFELYQISAAIRSYLQPKFGCYTTTIVKLLPWAEKQGHEVFRGIGSENPSKDLEDLLFAFEGDKEIVFHPFFLTRLADLWQKGERFYGAGQQPDRLTRTRYVIETFIQRESGEKWIDRDGNPLMNPGQHTFMLAVVAEEMWRSGAFRLSLEELKVAVAMALNDLGISGQQAEGILERVPTHAALLSRDRGYSFLHERFFSFFLGYRVAEVLRKQDRYAIEQILSARELSPHLVEWVVWNWQQMKADITTLISLLDSVRGGTSEGILSANIAYLYAKVLQGYEQPKSVNINRHTFVGDALANGRYKNLCFNECNFWHIDLSSSHFDGCSFVSCIFGDMHINSNTKMQRTNFQNCRFTSIDIDGEGSVFSPIEIEEALRKTGGDIPKIQDLTKKEPEGPSVQKEVIRCIERYVRASEKTCDVAIEEMENTFGSLATDIAKIGLNSEVLKHVTRRVSGPKKTFVRFCVNRDKFLRAQIQKIGDSPIDTFWQEIARKYRSKR